MTGELDTTDPLRLIAARHAKSCDDLVDMVEQSLPLMNKAQMEMARAYLRSNRTSKQPWFDAFQAGEGDPAEQLTRMTAYNQACISLIKELIV